jgi:phage protein U
MFVRSGTAFGRVLIEMVKSKSAFLNCQGVGKKIEFELELRKSPTAASAWSIS